MTMTKKSKQTWERTIQGLSYNSVRSYRQTVALYEEFHGLSMDELIQEALDEQSKGVPQHELQVYDRIVDFRGHLIEEGRLANGVATYVTRIRTVYKKCRVSLPYIPPVSQINANRSEVIKFEDYLTKDELRRGIQYLPLIQQARMMAMVSGGLSNDECANLQTKRHFIDALYQYHQCDDDESALRFLAESNNIIWVICIKRGKTGKPFYAIMNPECVTLTARAKLEELKPLRYGKKARVLDDRLYPTEKNYFGDCCRRINDGLGMGYVGVKHSVLETDADGSATIPHLHFSNFRPTINGEKIPRNMYVAERDGDKIHLTFPYTNQKIEYNHGGKSRFRPHMFRKFHATSVRGNYHIGDAQLSPLEIDELQGRGMTSVQETYIKSNPIKQKFLYCQIMNNVSLWHKYGFKVVDDDVEVFVVDDEAENKKLKKENENLKEKLEMSQDVKEDIKKLLDKKGIDEVVDIVSQLLNAS